MNDVLYDLAATTGNDHWASVGDRFTKKAFFNPLALGRDELKGLHVNTHIPQVIGAARRYEISSDNRFREVANYFWYEVVTARTYVTGGTSNGEGWLAQPHQLAAELKRSTDTTECCCAYNMMKLTRHLYSWTGDPRYFDYYERTVFNHRLGTILPEKGYTQYYLSADPRSLEDVRQRKTNRSGAAREPESRNIPSSTTVFTGTLARTACSSTCCIASELDWRQKGIKIRQETAYPEQQSTTLHITAARPTEFRICASASRGGWKVERLPGEDQRPVARGVRIARQLSHHRPRSGRAATAIEMELPDEVEDRSRCPTIRVCARSSTARSCWLGISAPRASRRI